MKRPLVIACVCCAALLGGCSSVSPPEVTVGTASVAQTDSGSLLLIELSAENPNREPLPLREVRYTVEVNGARVFEGIRSAESTLRRYGSRAIVLPVALPQNSAGNTGAGTFRIFGELTYKEPGALAQTLLDVELIDPSVGFSGNGSFGAEQK